MAITKLARIFKYGSLTLEDPNPSFSPDEVKDYWAGVYPELTQATVEEGETTAEGVVYEISKSYGTKGMKDRIVVSDLAAGIVPAAWDNKNVAQDDISTMRALTNTIMTIGERGTRILPPAEAQGMI